MVVIFGNDAEEVGRRGGHVIVPGGVTMTTQRRGRENILISTVGVEKCGSRYAGCL